MSNVDVSATGNEVPAAYHGHQAAAQVQYALVEGVAAIALAVVVLCLGRAALRRAPAPLGTALIVAGLAAAADNPAASPRPRVRRLSEFRRGTGCGAERGAPPDTAGRRRYPGEGAGGAVRPHPSRRAGRQG
jgi:hypothetical protein